MPTDIITLLGVIAALSRQAEIWLRNPVDPGTVDGRRELASRHERVKQFLKLVQTEAESLK